MAVLEDTRTANTLFGLADSVKTLYGLADSVKVPAENVAASHHNTASHTTYYLVQEPEDDTVTVYQ